MSAPNTPKKCTILFLRQLNSQHHVFWIFSQRGGFVFTQIGAWPGSVALMFLSSGVMETKNTNRNMVRLLLLLNIELFMHTLWQHSLLFHMIPENTEHPQVTPQGTVQHSSTSASHHPPQGSLFLICDTFDHKIPGPFRLSRPHCWDERVAIWKTDVPILLNRNSTVQKGNQKIKGGAKKHVKT